MSAIGEFLREIMPSWLNRPVKDRLPARSLRSSGRYAHGQGADDARALALEADRIWEQNLDEGLHCEAFPEPITGKRVRSASKRGEVADKREKPAGSSGPH